MKHPVLGDIVNIRFAGSVRTGKVVEIDKTDTGKKWVVLSGGIFYPALTLDKSKMNHILNIVRK